MSENAPARDYAEDHSGGEFSPETMQLSDQGKCERNPDGGMRGDLPPSNEQSLANDQLRNLELVTTVGEGVERADEDTPSA